MREVAEAKTINTLLALGLIRETSTVIGARGATTNYVAKPAEDLAARAIAEEAQVTAMDALEAAGSARADAAQASHAVGSIRGKSALGGGDLGFQNGSESAKLTTGPFQVRASDVAPVVINVNCDATVLAQEDGVGNATTLNFLREADWDAVLGLGHQPVKKVDGHVLESEYLHRDIVDRVSVDGDAAHSVSPLRSGLCADTQSSPASTVAETGCACQGAASGAGVSSAAPASQTSEGGAA